MLERCVAMAFFKKKPDIILRGMDRCSITSYKLSCSKGLYSILRGLYEETFSPFNISSYKILIAKPRTMDYEKWLMDTKPPSYGHHFRRKSIMDQPRDFVNPKYPNHLRVSCYTDAGYLTDADNLKSQTGYVFVLNGGAVDWKSTKQSIFATHQQMSEILKKTLLLMSSKEAGTSTRPSFSPGSSRSAQNLGKAECSNCKFLAEKIKTLEARIRILEGQLEMERHPENHTLESAAILHEIYNGMGNLNME
ncbi:hypothetical protein Tco_1504852 [Tanacetum coccineum]